MEELTLRHAFALLDSDAEHLDSRGLAWETIIDSNSKWILIRGFPIPKGYNVAEAEIALMVPESYPTTQFDMVYVNPALSLIGGETIGALSMETHDGRSFQRWSRHRTPTNPWRSDVDDLSTHLGLVEEWFLKETKKNG